MKEAGYEDGFKLTLWGDNTTQEIKGMTFLLKLLLPIFVEPLFRATSLPLSLVCWLCTL